MVPHVRYQWKHNDAAGNLNLGGPAPIGGRKASLSDAIEPYMQEIALGEQVRSQNQFSLNCSKASHTTFACRRAAYRHHQFD